jgi:hypothetical protein
MITRDPPDLCGSQVYDVTEGASRPLVGFGELNDITIKYLMNC